MRGELGAVVCFHSQRPPWLVVTGRLASYCFHSRFPWHLAPSLWRSVKSYCAVMANPPLLGLTHLSVVSLRVCLNNIPPLPHWRWQHLQVFWANQGTGCHVNGAKWQTQLPAVFSFHFITNTCPCPPLCCRSIPSEGLTGVNTAPASCGDWWLRGSNVQVHVVLSLHQYCII